MYNLLKFNANLSFKLMFMNFKQVPRIFNVYFYKWLAFTTFDLASNLIFFTKISIIFTVDVPNVLHLNESV